MQTAETEPKWKSKEWRGPVRALPGGRGCPYKCKPPGRADAVGGRSPEAKVKAARSHQVGEWWRSQSEEQGTLFPGGLRLGPQSHPWALGTKGWLVQTLEPSKHLPREGPEAVSVPTMAAVSLFSRLPASPLPGGRPQGLDFCGEEAALVQMQLRKATPALLQGVSKGPRDATLVPRPVLCPRPMPAPPASWAPAQAPAEQRTAGKSQGRAWAH